MQVEQHCVVSLLYSLREIDGAELEASDPDLPMAYLHGHGNLLPALEAALTGANQGDELQVRLAPAEAYGELKPNQVQRVPIKHLHAPPKRLQVGAIVRVQFEQGARPGRVVKVGKFNVDVDFNHPFAGKHLQFDVRIVEVRAATPQELAHGHAHGAGGHHH